MKKVIACLVILLVVCCTSTDLLAQCPMCKTALEEARKNGSQAGETLNSGILYLLALPYLIATTFGLIWYRNYRLKKKQQSHNIA